MPRFSEDNNFEACCEQEGMASFSAEELDEFMDYIERNPAARDAIQGVAEKHNRNTAAAERLLRQEDLPAQSRMKVQMGTSHSRTEINHVIEEIQNRIRKANPEGAVAHAAGGHSGGSFMGLSRAIATIVISGGRDAYIELLNPPKNEGSQIRF